jgi:hypothetical protein
MGEDGMSYMERPTLNVESLASGKMPEERPGARNASYRYRNAKLAKLWIRMNAL